MVLPRRKSILSQEERIKRLKESRLKYSQIGKTRSAAAASRSDEQSASSVPTAPAPPVRPTVVPRLSIAVPRPSFAPRQSFAPRPSIAPKQTRVQDADDEFEIDNNSLAMIKSGKITIPTNRPSISAARHTIGSRQSLARPFGRFRNSIAQEPRPSLMPLGINVFEASANQRNDLSEFFNSMTTTPAKPGNTSSAPNGNVFSNAITSTRNKKIRFMEIAIQEVRESAESAEVAAASSSIHHSPTVDTSFMPTSILSTKKSNRKKVNLGNALAPTPRRIVFEDDDLAEEPETENIGPEIENLEKIIDVLSNPNTKLTSGEEKKVRELMERLHKSLESRHEESRNDTEKEVTFKTPLKRALPVAPIPLTPLGSILENVNLEDSPDENEAEVSERKKKKLRRSSRMKVGGDVRRSLAHRRSSRMKPSEE